MSGWEAMLAKRSAVCELPGAELERFPYLSGYGLLLRITRLTALEPGDMKSVLGIRGGGCPDLLASTARLGPAIEPLLRQVGLAGSGVDGYWTVDAWSPLKLHGAWSKQRVAVRRCVICARFGYHSMLFQLPSIGTCPWHGCPLTDHCRDCEAPNDGGFGAGGQLGACSCGCDVFDPDQAATRMWEFPTASASAWMEMYLRWAEAERPKRHLVVRSDSAPLDWAAGFSVLAAPPTTLLPLREAPHVAVRALQQPLSVEPAPGHFWGWSQLSGNGRPMTYLSLPEEVRPALTAATKRAIAALPQGTATPIELVETLGFDRNQPLASNVANRTDCFFAPFGERSDGPTWLNVSAVDPYALAVCEQLVLIVAETFGRLEITTDRSWQTALSQSLDQVRGRGLLGEALRDVLTQGYEQGIEAVLRLQIGRPWPANRPWLEAILECRGQGDTLESIRIAWVPSQRDAVRRAAPGGGYSHEPWKVRRAKKLVRRRRQSPLILRGVLKSRVRIRKSE